MPPVCFLPKILFCTTVVSRLQAVVDRLTALLLRVTEKTDLAVFLRFCW